MKKIAVCKLDYSPLNLRKLTRVPLPPPSFQMKDKKHSQSKSACRKRIDF